MTRGLLISALFGAAALWGAAPVWSQADERIAELRSEAGAPLLLNTALLTAQTILFPAGEQIIDIIVSEPAAYELGVSLNGDSLVLVPGSELVPARLTVETERARYDFDLVPADPGTAPLVVKVANAGSTAVHPSDIAVEVPPDTGQYRVSGERNLRPAAISDDGEKTYLGWHDGQAMPAVFGIGPSGDEEMVEGYMRGGFYTIDRTYGELVFRIDKKKAKARRRSEGRRR